MVVVLEPLVGGRVRVIVSEETEASGWRSVALFVATWAELKEVTAREQGGQQSAIAET